MAGSKGLKRVNVGLDLSSVEYHDEAGIEIASGTSFPASPSQKDLYYRTDLSTWFQHSGGEWKSVGEPHLPVSQLIWKSGSTYYRRDGDTGSITSNSAFSTILQGALDAVTSNGGIVFMRAGTYIMGTKINLKPNVWLMGEGMYKTILEAGLGGNLLEINTGSMEYDMYFSDFQIDGKKSSYNTTTGMRFYRASRIKFIRLYIHHCGTQGLIVHGEEAACDDIEILGCRWDDCGYDGIPVGEHNLYLRKCTNAQIVNCISTNSYGNGYQVRDSCQDIEFINCKTAGCDDGFYICTDGNMHAVLTNCIARDATYGFWMGYETTTKDVSLMNCVAEGCTYGAYVGHTDKAAEDISIIGGRYRNNSVGIKISDDSNYFIILGVNARGNTTALSYPVGATKVVDHNLT